MTARAEEQRELFQEFAQEAPVRKEAAAGAQPKRFVFTFSFEGLLLSALGAVLVILVSFSVGVEMGRSYRLKLPLPLVSPVDSAAVKDKPPLVVQRAQVQTPVAASALTPPSIPTAAQTAKPAPAAPAAARGPSFIIQIASFKKAEQAQAENLRLIKSGFPSLVRKSGSFYMVVVGPYPTKMEALQSMSRLRNKYHDALVRKSSVN